MEGELLRHPVVPVAWVALVQLGAWGLGDRILGSLFEPTLPGEGGSTRPFHAVLVGFGVLELALFGLGLAGGLQRALLGLLVLILAVDGGARLRGRLVGTRRPRARSWIPLLVPTVVLGLFLPSPLSPILHHDDATYHLRLPELYLDGGRLVELPTLIYANMPHGGDLLGVLGLVPGDLAGPKLMTFSFVAWLLVGIAGFVAPRIGVPATAILLLSVLAGKQVQWLLSTANVEPLLACLFLGAVLALLAWRRSGDDRWLLLLGAHLGFACAVKYTAWPLATLLGVVVLGFVVMGLVVGGSVFPDSTRTRPPIPWRSLILAGLFVLVFVAPWLIRNAAVTGNPLYPNFSTLLDGAYWSPVQEHHWHRAVASAGGGPEKGPLERALSPIHLTLGDDHYNAPSFSISLMLGLLLAPFLLWRAPPEDRLLVVLAWAGFVLWAAGPMNGRYLVAWMGPLALGAATVLRPLRRRPWALGAALLLVLATGVWQLRTQRYPYQARAAWLSDEGREEELAKSVPWRLASWLEARVPPRGRILAMWENRFAFLDREVEVDSVYEAPTGLARLRSAGSAARFVELLRARGITHVLVHVPQMRLYLEDAYGWDLVVPGLYPRERFDRDRELVLELLREKLEPVETVGPWALLRVPGERKARSSPRHP